MGKKNNYPFICLNLGLIVVKESGKLRKSIETPILMGLGNIHEAYFVMDNP